MKALTSEQQLTGFIAKFTPEMARQIKAVRTKLRRRLPTALELVYDNYNFFVIGFSPTERPSEAIFSIAAHARGIALCFLLGAKLPDPQKLLRGSGNRVRSLRLIDPTMLERPDVKALIATAIEHAPVPFSSTTRHRLIIRSVSAKQRPRRTGAPASGKSKIENPKSEI